MTNATTDKASKQVAINDIGSAEDFLAAVEKTLKFFNDGDLIEGTVVKIDRDEVLLDVGGTQVVRDDAAGDGLAVPGAVERDDGGAGDRRDGGEGEQLRVAGPNADTHERADRRLARARGGLGLTHRCWPGR